MKTKEIELMNLKTNHILHLVLSILTAGIWLIVWLFVAMGNNDKRQRLIAEINGVEMKEEPTGVLTTIFIMALVFTGLFFLIAQSGIRI